METRSTVLTTVELLGGEQVFSRRPTTGQDWVHLVRQGFPFVCASELARRLGLQDSQLASTLAVSPTTLGKRRRRGFLTVRESEKILRIAMVFERATEVFQAPDAAVDWLNSRNSALSGVTPLSLLDTEFGAEEVSRILGTIEHGVFV